MKAIASAFAFLSLAFVLAATQAQDEPKKDDPKDAKKEDAKKEEKKLVFANPSDVIKYKPLRAKVRAVKFDETDKEVTVSTFDATKFPAFNQWDFKARGMKDRNKYLAEKAKRLDEVFSGEEKIYTLTDVTRVRTMLPPQIDDNGKKLPAAKINALKFPPLPGYKGEFASLRIGQIVDVYVAAPATPKTPVVPKKAPAIGLIGQDPGLAVGGGPKSNVLMILVVEEAN